MPVKNRMTISCDWCGKVFEKWPSIVKMHNFCCRQCLADFSNKSKNPGGYKSLKDYTGQSHNMTLINRVLNHSRMTASVRSKLRQARLQTEHNVKTYAKYYGQHQHRLVAEQKIGRKLLEDEVVHHIDGDKRNNHPDNLIVMISVDHLRLHGRLHRFWYRGGVDIV